MAHDLIIRNGTIIDGTGSQGYRADVAIDGDRITAIGDLSAAQAAREIDASGLIVSPGFVDLHTHLDAQVAWDPMMTSSSWHGITTVLIGNCGVTFAPVAPDHRVFLAEMMESVQHKEAVDVYARTSAQHWVPSLNRAKQSVLDRLSGTGLPIPVLVVWGKNDRSAPVELGHQFFELLTERTEDCAMFVINRAGHQVFRDRPATFNAAVIAFLRS